MKPSRFVIRPSTDYDAYVILMSLADGLNQRSAGCWSTASSTALKVGAKALLRLACALHTANIRNFDPKQV